jgi:multidrug efflux pump subunit AcrB
MESKEIAPKEDSIKEFALSTASVNNRKTVYLVLVILLIFGVSAYMNMSRESFPEIQIPEIYVQVPYPGNSPDIVRDKVIKPIEKELNKIKGVETIEATAMQDFGFLIVKFDFSVKPKDAKDLVEAAVNDARGSKNFAQDLPVAPSIKQMDVSDMPVLNINLSGDYPVAYLKEKAEYLKDKLESVSEISDVDIRGVQEQKLKIELIQPNAESREISLYDVEQSLQQENLTIGAGNLKIDGIDHFVMFDGKLKDTSEIYNLVVKHDGTKDIYLYEVAKVSFGDTDTTSYARQSNESVVMIDIKKRAGSNIIIAIDNAKEIVREAQEDGKLKGINVTLTNDQSDQIRSQVSNLENSIIFGVILVVGILLFFLGLRNALFVGIAIPLSMFMSFMLLHAAGVSLNIMVLFSLVIALGMLVDNGIVVVENIYRLMEEEGYTAIEAAKKGVGEVAWPVIASTATTVAAFIPLALWPGIMGEFMQYLPITLMIVLSSSLFVALVINPVLAAVLMKVNPENLSKKATFSIFGVSILLGMLFYGTGSIGWGNIFVTVGVFTILNTYFLYPAAKKFQANFLPKLERFYERWLQRMFKAYRPIYIFVGTIGLLILSFVLVGVFPTKVLFFPDNEPNYINVFIEHPMGTDIAVTNRTTKEVKTIIDNVLKQKAVNSKGDEVSYIDAYKVIQHKSLKGDVKNDTIKFVSSVIEQVGKGTSDPMAGPAFGETPHKSRITVSFCESSLRNGLNTSQVKQAIEAALKEWDGAIADLKIIVDKESNGPPMKAPVFIEVTGNDDYSLLVEAATAIKMYLNSKNVEGAQQLATDVSMNKAEFSIKLNRSYLRTLGMSYGQVASNVRTALFGKDISTFEKDEEIYDINLRFGSEFRGDIDALLNQKIMFMNNRGQKLSIPIMSVVESYDIIYKNTAIKRKNQENLVVTMGGVKEGANPNEIVELMKTEMESFEDSPKWKKFKDQGVKFRFSGQMDEQQKEMAFLMTALGIAVFLILLIIVMQFNSFATPAVILMAVVLSLSGVFFGMVIFRDPFVVIMTMIGIISLAGVVVNNAIVLVDYTNELRARKRKETNLPNDVMLSNQVIIELIIKAGKTRLRPVLLTAITTVLGLIPMAIAFNIDFITLYTEFDPKIFIGGDNAIFFGPMSKTIIYGLTFATFMTLVVVPIMYYLLWRFKLWFYRVFKMKLTTDY